MTNNNYPQVVYLGNDDFWFKLEKNGTPFIIDAEDFSVEVCEYITEEEVAEFARKSMSSLMMPTELSKKLQDAVNQLSSVMKEIVKKQERYRESFESY